MFLLGLSMLKLSSFNCSISSCLAPFCQGIIETIRHHSSESMMITKQLRSVLLLAISCTPRQRLNSRFIYSLKQLKFNLLITTVKMTDKHRSSAQCNQHTRSMESTASRYQTAKNKRRLVQQNIKLLQQVTKVKEQIEKIEQQFQHEDTSNESQIKPLIDQIARQRKIIHNLRRQIDRYNLERAKDNVEYILREEDELKIMKKQQWRLLDERQIYLNKKQDKSVYLQKDVPYQQYEKDFLHKLAEVVHHNREQSSKITEIERQIRKYHLMKVTKGNQSQKVVSLDQITQVSKKIAELKQTKEKLQVQWKPHFQQFDAEFARLLHQASRKREELLDLEREEKIWETRISAIRDTEMILTDKNRRGNVKVSSKLRQKVRELIEKQQQKNKKKVNEEELKYQFSGSSPKQIKADNEATSSSPPLLPGQKKKAEKIFQLLHNDKNITKRIDRSPNTKQSFKASQNSNTDVSILPGGKMSKELSLKKSFRAESDDELQIRKWEDSEEPEQEILRESLKSIPKNVGSVDGVIKMQEMGMETVVQNWQEG